MSDKSVISYTVASIAVGARLSFVHMCRRVDLVATMVMTVVVIAPMTVVVTAPMTVVVIAPMTLPATVPATVLVTLAVTVTAKYVEMNDDTLNRRCKVNGQ